MTTPRPSESSLIEHALHLASLLDHATSWLDANTDYCWSCSSEGDGHAVDCAAAECAAAIRKARRAAADRRRMDTTDLVQAISEAEREAEEAIRVVNARIQCWDDEAHACVQAMRRAAELVGCLRRLVPSADLAALRDAFGTPGEGDVGAALARLYAPPR